MEWALALALERYAEMRGDGWRKENNEKREKREQNKSFVVLGVMMLRH